MPRTAEEHEMANKTILVPTTFDESSKRALELAKQLAGPLGVEVVLLHVHEPPVLGYPELPTGLTERTYTRARRGGEEGARGAQRGGGRAARRAAQRAIPRSRSSRRSTSSIREMVVMGTHGRRGSAASRSAAWPSTWSARASARSRRCAPRAPEVWGAAPRRKSAARTRCAHCGFTLADAAARPD